jgi:hypothetical protein
MMSHDRKSQYRGSAVIVRWKESKSSPSPGKVFTAGYRLTSASGKQTDWRNFATLLFHTSDTAVAYALGEAHRFIDGQLVGSRQSQGASGPE